MKKLLFYFGIACAAINNLSYAQDFYDRSTIQTIEIYFGFSDWDAQLDNLASTTEDYLLADSVRINGITFDSVGVKYKGNSSYNANNNKNPIHIELDYIHGSYDYLGYTDIKLQNGYQDPSMIREVLSYAILEQYMDCPKANFANVYINGSLRGLYSSAESINDKFNGDHYYSSNGSFFKCNPSGGAGPGGGGNPDLNYLGMDSSLYSTRYELKSDYGWNDLVELINTLNNNFSEIETVLDVDRALWMLAFNNVLVNLDSYSGAFRQNYYLYNDLNDRFVTTVWDLNMSFGGFPGGTGSGTTDPVTLDPMSNSTSTNHPLIVKMLADPTYKRMYMAHLRTILQENFSSSQFVTWADEYRTTIDASVQADPYKFFTYTQFQNSLTTGVTGGGPGPGSTIPGLKAMMDSRYTYFTSNSNYLLVAPVITTHNVSNATPSYGESLDITLTCSNATSVYLGYRLDHTLKFNRIEMFDDGTHNDGASGDGVYGANIILDGVSLEYYFYAENSNAGLFNPQRAEHEYHSLTISLPYATVGDVVINELMADNVNTAFDSNGETNDWIELFNTTEIGIDLSGLYLTDDPMDLMKWMIPLGTSIAANDVLIIWADEDSEQSGLHANFKLSTTGENLILSNGATIFDQIIFGTQYADVSYARCPDGGTFTYATPTFDQLNNCFLDVEEIIEPLQVTVYPVPAVNNAFVSSNEGVGLSIKVVDLTGRIIHEIYSNEELIELPSSLWNSGYYRILVESDNGKQKSMAFIKE